MIEWRARNKLDEASLKPKLAKILQPSDVDILLTGPVRVLKPDGSPLCVYVPGGISPEIKHEAAPILGLLKGSYTNNRGMASGGERISGGGQRTYARAVDSAIAGAWEAHGPKQFCRLTAWTGNEMDKYVGLFPLFQQIANLLEEHVPERYANQVKLSRETNPAWVIDGTPFTTITINNTWPTATHHDKGDLDAGFSTLAVFREGDFSGGWLCFPEYKVGVDLQDGDVLLMDAHEWHGNTQFSPEPERKPNGQLLGNPGFERISVVCYYRTRMAACGSIAYEDQRRAEYARNRQEALVGE